MNTNWSGPTADAITNTMNWLDAATDDIRSARRKMSDRHLRSSPSIVTDNQQASEKTAKSWLAWYEVPYDEIEAVGHSTVGALAVLASRQFHQNDLAALIIPHALTHQNALAAINMVELTLSGSQSQRRDLRRKTKSIFQKELPSISDPNSEQPKPVTLDEWRQRTSRFTPQQVRHLIDAYEILSRTLYRYISWIPQQWIDLKPLTNEDLDFRTWLHDRSHVGLPTKLTYPEGLLPDQISTAYNDAVLEAFISDLIQKYPHRSRPSQIDMRGILKALSDIQLASTWLFFSGIITDLHIATSRYPSDASDNIRLGRQHYDHSLGVMHHIETITAHNEATIASLRSFFTTSNRRGNRYLK